ncbi:tRNA lysidine(34) synthetase TilS [Nonlabens ponticola]|uniref:tRNA(Ile)-lysidine synthase n=1 Tax=Nonlabens ponticola TaxID=2496866 RepID=A0A3S9N058_9FLAO|nr:tRNA lysidine(34) synthetase TilS [Nonlabens ponticola]AZQ44713.1 tRNA lysidine(34) synthetase TilS [Nonlabens ponticola]
MMVEDFSLHIDQHFPKLLKQKILLAVSGGLDSVVLAHLLKRINVDFAVAHCNFKLRGDESDNDAWFVENLAHQLGVKFHKTDFDTLKIASQRGISTQMAARDLRYEWFQEICKQHNYDKVVTAHHLDDQLETFLINLNRGTGLKGLTGIPAVTDLVYRPLLTFSRQQIQEYAKANAIKCREDSSNRSNKYMRNSLRNEVLPALHQALPQLRGNFAKSLFYLDAAMSIVEGAVLRFRESVTTQKNAELLLDIEAIKLHEQAGELLYHLLNRYGFNDSEALLELLDAQSGKRLISETHELLKDREHLILSAVDNAVNAVYTINENDTVIATSHGTMEIEELGKELATDLLDNGLDKNQLLLDLDQLEFPLTLKIWEQGDRMKPYGMKGSKLISDLLIDIKVSQVDKRRSMVLKQGDTILWLVGLRSAMHGSITDRTRRILKISLND